MKWLTDAIIPRWAVTLGVMIFCASAWGGFYYWAYSNGVKSEQGRVAKADLAEISRLAKRNFELQTLARDNERQKVLLQNELTKQYETRKENAEINTSNLIKRVDSGAIKLRIATREKPSCNSDSATLSTATRTVNQTAAELSPEASGFLITFASQCDATAEKLNLCIDIAEADRKENSLTGLTLGSEVQAAPGSVRVTPLSSAPADSMIESQEVTGAVMSTSIDLTNKEISNEVIK